MTFITSGDEGYFLLLDPTSSGQVTSQEHYRLGTQQCAGTLGQISKVYNYITQDFCSLPPSQLFVPLGKGGNGNLGETEAYKRKWL